MNILPNFYKSIGETPFVNQINSLYTKIEQIDEPLRRAHIWRWWKDRLSEGIRPNLGYIMHLLYNRGMSLIALEKYKLKLRSLPNSHTFSRYLNAFMYFLAVLAAYNFIAICLIYDDFMPRVPGLFLLAIPAIFYYTYHSIENEFLSITPDKMKEVIVHIRLKQKQSLIEKLEANPEVLYGAYNKKSLLYWARHHNNVEANAIIIEHMKRGKK